jgi:hypothetical protein
LKRPNRKFNSESANEIITESGGVQEVAAPPLRPTAEERDERKPCKAIRISKNRPTTRI